MKLSINANMCDQATAPIADVIRAPLKAVSRELSKDYGGAIEHLWIDFELIEAHAKMRSPYAFRFQKKVGGSIDRLTGLRTPVHQNVGHYSVRPDYRVLRSTPLVSVADYVLREVYLSTAVLIEKRKRLGGFDAERFRSDFAAYCRERGNTFSREEKEG